MLQSHMDYMTHCLPGAQDDLEKVTDLAYRQVVEYGMSPRVGHVSFPIKKREEIGRKIYSEKLSKMIDEVSLWQPLS